MRDCERLRARMKAVDTRRALMHICVDYECKGLAADGKSGPRAGQCSDVPPEQVAEPIILAYRLRRND